MKEGESRAGYREHHNEPVTKDPLSDALDEFTRGFDSFRNKHHEMSIDDAKKIRERIESEEFIKNSDWADGSMWLATGMDIAIL